MTDAIVLDASVAVSWCFPNDPSENTSYSRMVLNRLRTADAVVPEIWPIEIANILHISLHLRKRISEADANEFIRLLKALHIIVQRRTLWENLDLHRLAGRHNMATYDMAYLDLAIRQRIPLATSDKRLVTSALAEGVEVLTA